jgi:divalent metal cation (Fe/Co/Zn/Cd) transporter
LPRQRSKPESGRGASSTSQPHVKTGDHSPDIRAQSARGELAVSFHCTLDPATAITAAHDLTVRLEEYLRAHVPGLGRVAIHVEPQKP